MQLSITQQMKMSQQMKLAPRMIQSMEILQLPILALQERIEQELAENVVLENGDSDSVSADADSPEEEPLDSERVTELAKRGASLINSLVPLSLKESSIFIIP